ncbi:alpha/beta hydrolase [Paenibacillus sp. GSMTC-2017]|uniref:alpha/beta hydrolase family protein n=1 Tax=Paenibacillus sp. GSMTC-2017 TaxID=2794350 RepID=UPI0018D8403D|nr:alpha/beta hydrolase [Paenibacillus sp. GSMTC-2017]MBH5319563.1 alpha/beta hydrolase [Paenibacillus sp. GSMTC-2017]
MAILIFFIALIVEITIATYCIMTKNVQKKMRNWIRIIVFIVFIMFTFSSAIEWSLRWVLIAILLFILAAVGAVSLIRNKVNVEKYKTSRIVRKAFIMTVVFVLALAPALIFPQYTLPKETGKHEVATATYTYTDKNRIEEYSKKAENRFVNVQFWYPDNVDETYPLLVFSHGAYGIKESNTSTFTELASHGYIVVSIDHPYHSFYTASDDGTVTMVNNDYFQQFNNTNKNNIYTKEEIYGLKQKWMKVRTDDMNFVIDTILNKSKSDSDVIYQLINRNKIGVFGHSMGGAASVSLGRERNDISAVINIDGPMFSELTYNKETLDFEATNKPYTTTLLNIYSDDVWKQLETISVYSPNKAASENFREVYTVYFQGSKHLSLTDLPLYSPILATILQGGKATADEYYVIETQNKIIVEFFDYTLKGVGRFTSEGTYGLK